MAAYFEVETGTGSTTSNSYVSEADADQYHDDVGNATAWDAVTSKTVALVLASQFIDNEFRGRWKGVSSNDNQAMSWPRHGVVTAEGRWLESDTIPQRLKDAVCELALKTASDTLMPDQTANAGVVEEEVEVGPIKERVKYAGAKPQQKLYALAKALVSDYLKSGRTMQRS